LPDAHTHGIGIFGPYAQIYDGKEGDLSELTYIHSLDIEISGPYARISDDELGYLS
jgi:hypothetical protein